MDRRTCRNTFATKACDEYLDFHALVESLIKDDSLHTSCIFGSTFKSFRPAILFGLESSSRCLLVVPSYSLGLVVDKVIKVQSICLILHLLHLLLCSSRVLLRLLDKIIISPYQRIHEAIRSG